MKLDNFASGLCLLFVFKSKRIIVAEAHIVQAMEMMRNVSKRKFPEVIETIVIVRFQIDPVRNYWNVLLRIYHSVHLRNYRTFAAGGMNGH